ncbi:MAG: hypothetical protein N2B06_17190, partial [Clostridium sp.]
MTERLLLNKRDNRYAQEIDRNNLRVQNVSDVSKIGKQTHRQNINSATLVARPAFGQATYRRPLDTHLYEALENPIIAANIDHRRTHSVVRRQSGIALRRRPVLVSTNNIHPITRGAENDVYARSSEGFSNNLTFPVHRNRRREGYSSRNIPQTRSYSDIDGEECSENTVCGQKRESIGSVEGFRNDYVYARGVSGIGFRDGDRVP